MEKLKETNMETEPIVISEIVKMVVSIIAFLATVGILSNVEASQLAESAPAVIGGIFTLVQFVNWIITIVKQRGVAYSPKTVATIRQEQIK